MRYASNVWRRARIAPRLAAVALLVSAGCSRSDFPETYPVSGTVLLSNGKPLQTGKIEFESLVDANYRGMGEIEKDGTFARVYTYKSSGREVPGLIAGEHRVRIEVASHDEDEIPARDPGEVPLPGMAAAAARRKPPPVEPRYRAFDTSGLKITVPAPSNRVTIQLGKPGA